MARERRLDGGNTGGAVRVGDTVRRLSGPWTPAVHSLLERLHEVGFAAPRPLGFDESGREVLTFLPGQTVGDRRPWPPWVHSDAALVQVATWLRAYHSAVADFRPADDAVWRAAGRWRPGLIVGHNDAAPYNAAWTDDRLTGFFDWDFAGPVTREWDLAFTAFAWVPLHARHVVEPEGFTAFADRPRRLRLFLDTYGWDGDELDFVHTVQARVTASVDVIRQAAAAGDTAFQRMLRDGADRSMCTAVFELEGFRTQLDAGSRPGRGHHPAVLGPLDALPGRPARVLVAGTSGSGKTTLARHICAAIGSSHTEIDALHHGPGWTVRPQFETEVDLLAAQDRWVTEYQYSAARPVLLSRADLVVYLWLPRWLVMTRVLRRTLRRSLRREPLWNGNVEPPIRTFFTDRDHIVRWAWRTHSRNADRIAEIHSTRPDLPIVLLRSRAAVAAWIGGPLAAAAR